MCIVSGGNIDVNTLNRVMTRGLKVGGRLATLTVDLADKPGQLSAVCGVISQNGGNIITVTHERVDTRAQINGCTIRLELETRNHEHIEQIRKALTESGFNVL